MRLLRAGGSVHFAPGASEINQIATSASAFAAHESGGGAGAFEPSSSPATSVTSTPSAGRYRGTSRSQNIVKYGAANFDFAGRFSQIWNSSSRFGFSVSSSGNISECTMPAPAVSHCTSPRPNRAVAPSESE